MAALTFGCNIVFHWIKYVSINEPSPNEIWKEINFYHFKTASTKEFVKKKFKANSFFFDPSIARVPAIFSEVESFGTIINGF